MIRPNMCQVGMDITLFWSILIDFQNVIFANAKSNFSFTKKRIIWKSVTVMNSL